MNYETYKTLTAELKEEYDWKFKEVPKLNFMMHSFFFIVYVIAIAAFYYAYSQTLDKSTLDLFTTISKIWFGFVVVLLLYLMKDIGNITQYYLNFNDWKTKNNIIEQKEKTRWCFW
jgi:uncharacterized membrane protein